MVFDFWRGAYKIRTNFMCNDFAIAYNRMICLKAGEYSIISQTIGADSSTDFAMGNIGINNITAQEGYKQTNDLTGMSHCSVTASLQRGDYITMKGGWYGLPTATAHSSFLIKRMK